MNAETLHSLLEKHIPHIARSHKTDDLTQFGQDWTRFHEPNAAVVFFPNDAKEVQEIVKLANNSGAVIVPSGGRTGYSAGAVATQSEWVVSLVRLNDISGFNEIDQTVSVGAGVITEQLHNFAEEHNLFYPVDFAPSGSSHIGGNIATDAGGIRVVRYGLTRD